MSIQAIINSERRKPGIDKETRMAYAEKRGKLWRARWRGPDGTLESEPGFTTKTAAEEYGRDQEAAIRGNTYVDPRSGLITLTEWVNEWFPSLDLEPSTLDSYRYLIEVHILPEFGHRTLRSLTAQEIAKWESGIVASGLSRRTAREARSTLANVLADAIPRHIPTNPAARKRGKGRKGQRRIERLEKQQKVWASPLQALLIAERAAVLSGSPTTFVMLLTIAYTGMRWSEAVGLLPDCIRGDQLDINWKLYELNGRFYRGYPKDGSVRTVDIPPFLQWILGDHLNSAKERTCSCRPVAKSDDGVPWCSGDEYVFLGPEFSHFRRSNFSTRIMRPASDGWYPGHEGKTPRPAMPVLVDMGQLWPGKPLPPLPPAVPGVPYQVPRGRGIRRLNDDFPMACWLPVLKDLTPHGLRHGHQTWMDEVNTSYVLQSERMGHEVSGMRGVYSHVTPRMRATLVDALQGMWEASLAERAAIAPHSPIAALDAMLIGPQQDRIRDHPIKIGSQLAPKIGHQQK